MCPGPVLVFEDHKNPSLHTTSGQVSACGQFLGTALSAAALNTFPVGRALSVESVALWSLTQTLGPVCLGFADPFSWWGLV